MKRFSDGLSSWWFATMTPAHSPRTTLAERERMRKIRLCSVMLLLVVTVDIPTMVLYSIVMPGLKVLPGWVGLGFMLCALWLNRRGHLTYATLLFFVTAECSIFITAHTLSLSVSFVMLFMIIFPLMASGLFLPAWMLFPLAGGENILLFWYILIVRHDQITHLLSAQALQSYLINACLIIYTSAIIGAIYSIATKKAVIQADRAVELEQAYTSLEAAHAAIQKQALTDALTDLPNHRAIMDQLNKELDRARRYSRPFSLLFFDADRFKHVNDTYGHAVGDAVLRQIGERASSVLRGGDTLGRFGGEEFVILLPEADAREASAIAERIRVAVATRPVATSEVDGGIPITVSIGLTTYPTDGASEQDLLSQADEAMYVAKRLGRNQVRTAEDARQVGADVELMALLQEEGQREAAQREGLTPERLRESYTLRIIYSLLSLLERRDMGLSAHAHAVSDLATAIASVMRLEPKHVSRIGMAGLLHDIGKVAMPDRLLQKASPLSSQERALLREHAELGAQILEASPFLYDLVPMVRHHHERWDGSGYPDQLAGEDIPLAARIIAVAEAYDAMQRELPYQASRSPEEAEAELWRCTGTQFDPAVVLAFSAMLSDPQRQKPFLQTAS